MAAFSLLTGYVATVWQNLRSTLLYSSNALTGASQSSAELTADLAGQSFRNGRDAIAASLLGTALATLYDRLSFALTLPLDLGDAPIALVTLRVATIQAAAESIVTLLPTPVAAGAVFPQGRPTISDPTLLEWLAGFSLEGDLGGQLDGLLPAGALAQAPAMAAAWAALLAALSGSNVPGSVIDAVEIMALVSGQVSTELSGCIYTAGTVSGAAAWNSMVAAPSIIRSAWALIDDPTSATWQQTNTMRYIVGQTLIQIYQLAFTLRQAVPTAVRVTTVLQNDTLWRIAARELGDFERFQEIAALNQLVPPYIAPQASAGVVTPGSQIFLPTTTGGTTAPASIGGVAPSYEVNYLGVDIYLGPLNQAMPAWTGDYQRIVGYDNLALSLGRRLQTTLGSLLYHLNYGSRIPPEVGAIAVQSTAGHLGAYAQSAILSDPRVFAVTSMTIVAGANYSINISANVQPNGSNGSGQELNEVIQPSG